MSRPVRHRYLDPLDAVWLAAARRIGLNVRRSGEVYAATDGRGTLVLGAEESLDPDDCLAQMIFHELCHSLVEGPSSFDSPDWGLDNETARDVTRERACLRLQAHLSDRHGLRGLLAPTTEHRAFYDALGDDPFAGAAADASLARRALQRAEGAPWAPHLERALGATADIARAVARAGGGEAGPDDALPPLWELLSPPPEGG